MAVVIVELEPVAILEEGHSVQQIQLLQAAVVTIHFVTIVKQVRAGQLRAKALAITIAAAIVVGHLTEAPWAFQSYEELQCHWVLKQVVHWGV